MKVGYARVSSQEPSLDTQIEKLGAFGCEKIFLEKRSCASRSKREAVNAALEYYRESHFFISEIVPTKDQIQVDVLAWLDEASSQRQWLERLEAERQPGLFD